MLETDKYTIIEDITIPDSDELLFDGEVEYSHLESDNDGHWYVIVDGEEETFREWIKSEEDGTDCEYDFSDCAVGGAPSLVHFRNYYIE